MAGAYGKVTDNIYVDGAHKDVTTRLLEINPKLAARVRKILDINKQERHIRGGMATKEKYAHHLQ